MYTGVRLGERTEPAPAKAGVENQVGPRVGPRPARGQALVRQRFFTPRLRVKSYEELNAWLLDQCVAYAKAHRHPERRDQTVWEMFEAERASLVRYAGRFDGVHAVPASVSKTCLVRFNNNRYSVAANANGRPAEIRAGACPRAGLGPSRGPIGSSCARMADPSANIPAASGVTRRCSIRGTTCRFWPASPARSGTAPPSKTGCRQPDWSGSVASSPVLPMAIVRWSTFSPPY